MMIRPYEPGDIDAVGLLFAERGLIFDRPLFEWKKQAPSVFSWVGVSEGQVVAHYCVIEMPLWAGVRTGFAVDAIFSKSASTVPNISAMLNQALEECKDAGIDVVIGFANDRMAPLKRFLGWNAAPGYSLQVSYGEQQIDGADGRTRTEFRDSPYDRWRWGKCPRTYQTSGDLSLIVKPYSETVDEAPLLLRFRTSEWSRLVNRFRFAYWQKYETPSKPQGQLLVPLYTWLSHDRNKDALWPLIWPMELVEGVTLGW